MLVPSRNFLVYEWWGKAWEIRFIFKWPKQMERNSIGTIFLRGGFFFSLKICFFTGNILKKMMGIQWMRIRNQSPNFLTRRRNPRFALLKTFLVHANNGKVTLIWKKKTILRLVISKYRKNHFLQIQKISSFYWK